MCKHCECSFNRVNVIYFSQKKSNIEKNVIYKGSIMSLDSFDTAGYLRLNTEGIYDEVI